MGPGRRTPQSPPSGGHPDTGAAALEFALVAPLLFMLVFGIFATGWGLWEYQAAQATAREAARLASVGITAADTYENNVRCLATTNGLGGGTVTHIDLAFHPDASNLATDSGAVVGGYATVRLTYASAVSGLPFIPWPASLTVQSVSRIEQVGAVGSAQTFDLTVAPSPENPCA